MDCYIIRHGETLWNAEGRYQGRTNSDLSPQGERQAHQLGQKMVDYGLKSIISSTAGRAQQTAGILRQYTGAPILLEDRIQEIYLGDWEGKLKTEIEAQWPEAFYQFRNEPGSFKSFGGESFFDVRERMEDFWYDFSQSSTEGPVAIVSHGAAIQCLLSIFQDRDVKDLWQERVVHQTSLTHVDYDPLLNITEIIDRANTDHLISLSNSPLGV
jgi:broad specificity phosphatase PhoE